MIDGQRRQQLRLHQHATGVTIEHLTIQNFVGPPTATRASSTTTPATAGRSPQHHPAQRRCRVSSSATERRRAQLPAGNGQYGFSAYEPDGVRDVVARAQRDRRQQHRRLGAPAPGLRLQRRRKVLGDHGRRGDPTTRSTTTTSVGLWADTNNTGFLVEGNYIGAQRRRGDHLRDQLQRRRSSTTRSSATARAGARRTGASLLPPSTSPSPAATRGPARAYGRRFDVIGNRFIDNWAGVIAWENADRFAGSPANTSTGYTHPGQPRRRHGRGVQRPDADRHRSRTSTTAGGRPSTSACRTTCSS